MQRVFGFGLFVGLLLATFLCIAASFCPSRAFTNNADMRNSAVVRAKPEKPRATRTLYKPQQDDLFELTELNKEMILLEKEITESTKAKLDLKRVSDWMEEDAATTANIHADAWQVSLAAGGMAAAVTLTTTNSLTLAVLSGAGVYVLANGDPLQEQSPVGTYRPTSSSGCIAVVLWFGL